MSSSGGDDDQGENQQAGQVAPRDLIDFYRRWAEFRLTVVRLAERSDLSALERQTVHWLIELVDRIGEHDVQP
jgi:hypothetical protein